MKNCVLLAIYFAVCMILCDPYPKCAMSASGYDADLVATIKKVLKNNPEIILNVLRNHSEVVLDIAQQGSNLRRKHNLEKQWNDDLNKKKDVQTTARPIAGNPNAKVKIIAFSDFSCHYCSLASKNINDILNEYGNDVSFIFKHLPLDEKGPGGIASSYFVAIALQDEQKAWDFYKIMYDNRENLLSEGEPFIKKSAQKIGVDMKRLQKDLQSKKVKDILAQDQEDAQKLGVEGTPFILVNDLVLRGALPLELFKDAVDMALKNAQ